MNFDELFILVALDIEFSRIHSNPRWIGTGSHSYEKTMSFILLYPAFYEYKNVQS